MGANDFAIDLVTDFDRLLVRVRGDLDLGTVPQLRAVLDDASQFAARDVCVDFSDAPFFDALTVAALAITARRLEAGSHHLRVQGLSRSQEAVVRLCGVQRLVAVAAPGS
jgi:anti-anti-sigma factor